MEGGVSVTTHRLSKHAKQRRKQMGVTEDQIELVLRDPDTTYPGSYAHAPGRTCHQRDNLVVVTNAEGTVVTILWHGAEGR